MDVHVTTPFRILCAAAGPIRGLAKAESEQGREVFRKVGGRAITYGVQRPRRTSRAAAATNRAEAQRFSSIQSLSKEPGGR
jgi:3-oxoacyl-[acyl-carrier protein] reductase